MKRYNQKGKKDNAQKERDEADALQMIQDMDASVEVDEVLSGNNERTNLDFNLNDVLSTAESKNEIQGSQEPVLQSHSDTHDYTIRTSKNLLVKMGNKEFFDVYQLQKKKIIHPDMDDYSIINSYRGVKTHLVQKSEGNNFVVMVVSIGEKMGTTFNAVNLAAAFSYEGEKTSLLVDCNKFHPCLNKIFEQDMNYGLTDYLDESDRGIDKIIYPTGINRMRFIPIGFRVDLAGEFLSSQRMKEFIRILKRRYADRYIFLDAPSLERSADAAVLSDVVDYILIVIPDGRLSKSRINKAIKLLPKEKVIGYILNNKKSFF